jgi:hypothetical protein
VTIGSRFLKFLVDKFEKRVALVVPSYNAGEGATMKWLRLRGDWPADEFAEEIPYDETATTPSGSSRRTSRIPISRTDDSGDAERHPGRLRAGRPGGRASKRQGQTVRRSSDRRPVRTGENGDRALARRMCTVAVLP